MNEDMEPQYVRVKAGWFGTKSVLIPVVRVSVDEERRAITLHEVEKHLRSTSPQEIAFLGPRGCTVFREASATTGRT